MATASCSSTASTASTDSVTSSCDYRYFPVNKHSPILVEKLREPLLRYGHKRATRAGIVNFQPLQDFTTVQHSDLILGDCVGKGSFGSCFTVQSSKKKQINASKVVVKVLRRRTMDNPKMFAACAGDLVKEGLLLAALNHRNVVSAKAFAHGGLEAYSNGRHDAFFLVLDKLKETLAIRILSWQNQKFISPFLSQKKTNQKLVLLKSKSDTILQLADAIEYIHSRGMIHRDIKPDNIGFDEEGILKVFDFDVARYLPLHKQEQDETFKMTKRVGSPRYMSPECALGFPYNSKVDVYAFGLLCHEILTLFKPYDDIPAEYHDDAVFVHGERPIITEKMGWTKGLESIVKRCWSPKVSARPTMKEAKRSMKRELPMYILSKTSGNSNKGNKTKILGGLFQRNKKAVLAH